MSNNEDFFVKSTEKKHTTVADMAIILNHQKNMIQLLNEMDKDKSRLRFKILNEIKDTVRFINNKQHLIR